MFSAHFVVTWISKDFGSCTLQFFSHWSETSFQKNFISVFQVWLLTTPVYLTKEGFYQQMQNSILNRLEPIRNRKNCLPCSFWNCRFRQNLIKIQFFRNSGHFWWSKSGRFRQKSLQNYHQRKILRRKIRKACFHYIFLSCLLHVSISIEGPLCPYMFYKIAMTMDLLNLGLN